MKTDSQIFDIIIMSSVIICVVSSMGVYFYMIWLTWRRRLSSPEFRVSMKLLGLFSAGIPLGTGLFMTSRSLDFMESPLKFLLCLAITVLISYLFALYQVHTASTSLKSWLLVKDDYLSPSDR